MTSFRFENIGNGDTVDMSIKTDLPRSSNGSFTVMHIEELDPDKTSVIAGISVQQVVQGIEELRVMAENAACRLHRFDDDNVGGTELYDYTA